MILADTSIWADHFRAEDRTLAQLLDAGRILIHSFVIGEIALGHLKQRDAILSRLEKLPHAPHADDAEVLQFINAKNLMATGIGYVDAHLLTATQLKPGLGLWTRDRRMHVLAERLGFAVAPDRP